MPQDETKNKKTEDAVPAKQEMPDDEIDENVDDTFPASDPPSWTLGTDHRKKGPQSGSKPK